MATSEVVLARACINCAFMDSEKIGWGMCCIKGLNPSLGEHPISYADRLLTKTPADLHPIDQMAQFCDSYQWGPATYPAFRKEALRRMNTDHKLKDPSRLALKFEKWYRPGTPAAQRPRIKVQYHNQLHYGTVAMSSGSSPVLLLMRTVTQRGSWVTLKDDTPVVAVAAPRTAAGKTTHWPYTTFYGGPQ